MAFLIATAAGLHLHCGEDPRPRPNLLLITLEDIRPDDLACYDPTAEKGYAICELAQEGGRFVWAFSTSPATGPAAATVLTGRSPTQHGVSESVASFLAGPETTLAEALRQGGYETAAFVSNPELNRSRHLHPGFDLYQDRLDLESLVAAARDWMNSTEGPWFIWAHLMRSKQGSGASVSESTLLRLDRSVAELITSLDDESRPRGILLTSLHGRGNDDASLNPELDLLRLRVPLLWQAPDTSLSPGVARKLRTPVSLVDVAPTLIEAAALPSPETARIEGVALPYADLPKRPIRTIVAEHAGATLVIHGAEFARFPSRSDPARMAAGSGRLWPAANPTSEQTPSLDTSSTGRARNQKLKRLIGSETTKTEPTIPRGARDTGFVQP
ncbi:MAG: sulfatase-like hydrolase/transferase [Myxococcota bacterium]|nr:sulfatase-like hydrolase/transferase [Myxococcota bacterium]